MASFASRSLQFICSQLSHSARFRLSQSRRLRSVNSLEVFLRQNRSCFNSSPSSLSIDLGSNAKPRNPFTADICRGIDINSGGNPAVTECDLFRSCLPLVDNCAAFVTAFDFIEHVPRIIVTETSTRFAFVELMNEVYRVLRPGGLFLSYTPAFPFKEAFQDPTHVNIITEDTFPFYFASDPSCELPGGYGSLYGFNQCFRLVDQAWHRFRLISLLQKPDSSR